jgi:alpha/beta superfamily hydrolase
MLINSTPISFVNSDGYRLFGILHKPEENVCREECIIILSPGIKSRVAPHRLYVKLARVFYEMGFPVLRFDFHGLGDSEGEIDEKFAADFYGSVQVGRYIDDTLCAMNWLEKKHQISNFILSGLCGGAITGLLTAVNDKRVKGLHSLSIPVVLDGSSIVYDEFLTSSELERQKNFYLSKLFTMKAWRSWIRFLTFQSDYRLIFRSFFSASSPKKQDSTTAEEKSATKDNRNPLFLTSFNKMISSKKQIFFIFAETDRLYWQFKENFIEFNTISLDEEDNIDMCVINNANHIFSFNEWQDKLIEETQKWIKKKF